MPSLNLTRTEIDRIIPTGKQTTYQDTKLPGFVLMVSANGAKTFAVRRRIGGRDERVTIGRFPIMLPETARKKAQELLGQMAAGINPKAEARRLKRSGTIGALFTAWMAHAKTRGARTTDQDEQRFSLHLAGWGERSPESITRADVREWHRELGEKAGKTTANRSAELLRRLYRFGAAQELLTCPCPTDGLEMFPEVARDRRIMPDEMARFTVALDDEPSQDMADLFRLLLLTGQRLSSVRAMRWQDVDMTGEVWRIPMTKNGKPQTVPLVAAAMAIIGRRRAGSGEWVFPSDGSASGHVEHVHKAWTRVCERAGITGLRIHDLRHTFASLLTDDGASTKQVGQAVGHRDQRSTDRYMHASTEALRPVIEAALADVSGLLAGASPAKGEG